MNEAVRAQKTWGLTPWKERATIIRKAADLISERRMEISAIMSLETGKNRLESLGDVEESAGSLSATMQASLKTAMAFFIRSRSFLPTKTREVFSDLTECLQSFLPFNFPPLALCAGMGGRRTSRRKTQQCWKTQQMKTPWCAHKLYECLRDAGLPNGVFQVIYGKPTANSEPT